MSRRFFRCRLCGLPHELDTMICPVVGQPIPAHRSILPAAGPRPEADEVAIPLIPRPPRPPSIHPPPPSEPATRPPSDRPSLVQTLDAPLETLDSGERKPVAAPPRPSERPPAPQSLLGSVVGGRYEVRGVIAEGGMGIVYEAVHVELGRRVAIKALARKFAEDSVAITRFRNEARVAGALGHPNIVEVFDLGTLPDGSPFLVMERLEGETLGARLKRDKQLPIAEVVAIAQQILSALSATHEHNIVHRDLKPENVFLSRRAGLAPVVKLLDFGISKTVMRQRAEDMSIGLTRAGYVMGTPTYMAPEQARGERDIDGRVDIYAVGVLVYEMLLGRPPYIAKQPVNLVAEMQKNRPPAPRSVRPEVPPRLEAAIEQLIMLDRRRRFPTARDALMALTDPSLERMDDGDDDPTVRTTMAHIVGTLDPDASQKVQMFSRADKPKA